MNELIPNFPTWRIDLYKFSDDAIFRISKNNIYSLVDALRIPNEVRCPNRQSIEAFGKLFSEAPTGSVLLKKVFLKISQYTHEITCDRVSFW